MYTLDSAREALQEGPPTVVEYLGYFGITGNFPYIAWRRGELFCTECREAIDEGERVEEFVTRHSEC